MSFLFSVTAFAGAPVLFEQPEGIVNTGGEGLGLMIGAGVLAVLAVGLCFGGAALQPEQLWGALTGTA